MKIKRNELNSVHGENELKYLKTRCVIGFTVSNFCSNKWVLIQLCNEINAITHVQPRDTLNEQFGQC